MVLYMILTVSTEIAYTTYQIYWNTFFHACWVYVSS